MTVEIKDVKHLEKVIKSIKGVDGVLGVERSESLTQQSRSECKPRWCLHFESGM